MPAAIPHGFRSLLFLGLLVLAPFYPLGSQPHAAEASAAARTVDFNRQIRPILSDTCFACHGPDDKQRKAKLRFDTKEGAFAALRNGGFAIVPGDVHDSELVARIASGDPEK